MNISYSLARSIGQPVLFVVRHGSTGDDDSYNSPENPHLDEKGKSDSIEAADFLTGFKTGKVVATDYHRSMETGKIIAQRLGKTDPVVDRRLDSWKIGKVADASSAAEADRMIKHHQQNPHKVIPGGESLNQLQQRVEPALLEGAVEGLQTGRPPIYSAHHSVQYETGRVFNGNKDSALTKTGGIIAVYFTPQGFKAVPIFKSESQG